MALRPQLLVGGVLRQPKPLNSDITVTMQPTLISEYPSISIDDFREKEEHRIDHYFLTHCHTDHLCGINRETLQKKVYCTEETKNILLNHPSNFRQIQHKLIETLPIDQPKIFNLRTGEDILVTFLAANHCPGSIMILIEGSQGNVLFTGDTRLERPFVRRLKKNPHLSSKPIRTLYCDTTFAQPHLSEFPLKIYVFNRPNL
ncbi:beta-lactamase-like protein [Paraphysoderma sedebokerense]|nr:beta-lactamase-like protein [Paraphysoderma sedebokerense]